MKKTGLGSTSPPLRVRVPKHEVSTQNHNSSDFKYGNYRYPIVVALWTLSATELEQKRTRNLGLRYIAERSETLCPQAYKCDRNTFDDHVMSPNTAQTLHRSVQSLVIKALSGTCCWKDQPFCGMWRFLVAFTLFCMSCLTLSGGGA